MTPQDNIEQLASKAFNDAYNKTLSEGCPATIVRDGKIVKVYPNGDIVEIGKARPKVYRKKSTISITSDK